MLGFEQQGSAVSNWNTNEIDGFWALAKRFSPVPGPQGAEVRPHSANLLTHPSVRVSPPGSSLDRRKGRRGSTLPGVKVKENESFEGALRRFKKQCEKAGIMFELRRREHYEKPSVRRKKKALAARKRALKRLKVAG